MRWRLERLVTSSGRIPARALCVWSVLYVLPHLYWAVGGDLGFSALKPSATADDSWQEINAVASMVLLLPAGIGVALSGTSRRTTRAGLLMACLGGTAIATSHGLYGIVYRVLNIVGFVEIEGRTYCAEVHPWVIWDLLVFEPWFLIEGALFAAAGWSALSHSRGRRHWVGACLIAIALATASGLLGLRVG